jgi:hypothetical protein
MKDDVVAPFAEGSLWESKSQKTITVIDPSNGRHHLSTISAGCEMDADSAAGPGVSDEKGGVVGSGIN